MNNALTLDKLLKTLLLLFLIILALYFAKEIFVPVTIAALISFLFLPLAYRLERLGTGRIAAIAICVLIILIILSALVYLFSYQMMELSNNMPQLEQQAKRKFHTILRITESATKIPYEKQKEWIDQMHKEIETRKLVQNIFFTTTNFLANLGLIVVYIFCFLYYRQKFSAFFIALSSQERNDQIRAVIEKIQKVASHYFSGILMVMFILGTMHSIGLLLLGIEHAVFLGYLAGMFILVPVVGTMVGSTIPFLIALITKDSIWYAVGVAGIFSFNLFIESQILTPLIVGSHIKINPMVVILAIVIGGFIWGLPGMVLFIPLSGMLKILSDNIQSLYPLSILLSDSKQGDHESFFKKFSRKIKKES